MVVGGFLQLHTGSGGGGVGGGGHLVHVDLAVSLHVPVAAKLFLTNITEEGLLAGVSPLVGLEMAQLGEGLATGLAFEGLQERVGAQWSPQIH